MTEATVAMTDRLKTDGGNYAMLALDQRESLRDMFARDANGLRVNDEALREFKQSAVEVLTPFASAVLLDRPYSVTGERPTGIADGCALIVAADVLHQEPGAAVTGSSFDELVTVDFLKKVGADAIKFLVIWREGYEVEARGALIERAVELARAAGVASLVEAIVRPAEGATWASAEERHEAILAAAAEVSAFRPDVYKAEVPGYTVGDVSKIAEHARRMSQIVDGDWVVLSNGVDKDEFASAVAAAREGGASGFLAGRAIWADTIVEADRVAAMAERSVQRLKNLTAIVDAT
ncbi:aldolase [Cryobacterium sp. N19]|uniref:aldolase n=1 Tax=Cryobacterium sp. N19 TaxID=2048288 RepID=UPI000CE52FDF|nr:aldolase [Cryobacterium sp. N19]